MTLRADARQNRAELLDAARQVIAEQGAHASLRDIARRAGVGIGTLYRHFPTREALIAALIASGVERMRARAKDLAATKAPGEALAAWLAEWIHRSALYQGLPQSLLTAMDDEDSSLYRTCAGLVDAGRELFDSAQAAGDVRADARWEDVFTAAMAISWATGQAAADPDRAERADRMLALVIDGLTEGRTGRRSGRPAGESRHGSRTTAAGSPS
jgi:AcrR family transcriptional regulator